MSLLPASPCSTRLLLCQDSDDLRNNMMNSWKFLMNNIEVHMHQPAALPKVHMLSYIVLDVPGMRRPDDREYPVVQLYEGAKVFFDSSKDCLADDTIRWEDDEKLLIECDRVLCGDYQLWLLTPSRPRTAASRAVGSISGDEAAAIGPDGGHGRRGFAVHRCAFLHGRRMMRPLLS